MRPSLPTLKFLNCLGVLVLSTAQSAGAATYLVRPDGAGDFPTIQAAVSAAHDGDNILLGSGTFTGPGNRGITFGGKALAFHSESGNPELTIIDCEHLDRGFHITSSSPGCSFRGFTIQHGRAETGGAMNARDLDQGSFVDCVFQENLATDGVGAVLFEGSPTFVRCRFIQNQARYAGAVTGSDMSDFFLNPTFEDCLFYGNVSEFGATALYLVTTPFSATMRSGTIRNCTFARNRSLVRGSIITVVSYMHARFENCTFADNESTHGSMFEVGCDCTVALDRCIVSYSRTATTFDCFCEGVITLQCTNVFGNDDGNWSPCVADQENQNLNFEADPLFCDHENGDYGLQFGSPCSAEQNPECGLVGAFGVECDGPVPVDRLSWGTIKSIFRR